MSAVTFTWSGLNSQGPLMRATDALGVSETETSSGSNATTTASCPFQLGGPCHVSNVGSDAVKVSFGASANASTDTLFWTMPPNSTLDVHCRYLDKGACINV